MFWGEFRRPLAALDRCTLKKGAFAFKIIRGALKWPLKGGSRLIEVAATAGLTVLVCPVIILNFRTSWLLTVRKVWKLHFITYIASIVSG